MLRGHVTRLLFILIVCGAFLYVYLEKLNAITSLQLEIPAVKRELMLIEEENTHLAYQRDMYKDPMHLMAFLDQPEFSHLKFAFSEEVKNLPQGLALEYQDNTADTTSLMPEKFSLPIRLGAKNFK